MFNITAHRGVLVLFVAMSLGAGGCTSTLSGQSYSREEARNPINVRFATVVSVREVTLEGTKSPIGGLGGAAVGGIAGSSIGDGKGSAIGAVIGAVAGGLAGAAIEESATRQPAWEITLRGESGDAFAVVQEKGTDTFVVGERVRVLSGNGNTRVSKE